MMSLFSPAVTLMGRLKYPQKFLLITLLFTFPLGALMYFFLKEIGASIAFNGKERLGVEYNSKLVRIHYDIQDHKSAALAVLAGESGFRERVARRTEDIERDFRELEDLDRRLGGPLNSTASLKSVHETWGILRAAWASPEPQRSIAVHSEFITALIAFLKQVGDASNLILDPELDTYYLMDSTVNGLPGMMERLGYLRGLGLKAAQGRVLTPDERDEFSDTCAVVRTMLDQHVRGLEVAFAANADLRDRAQSRVQKNRSAVGDYLGFVEDKIIAAEGGAFSRAEYFDAASKVIDGCYELHVLLSANLDRLVERRVLGYVGRRDLVLSLSAVMAVLVIYVYAGFYLSVRRTVASLRGVSGRLVAGEAGGTVTLASRDELAEVARSFNEVATALTRTNASLQLEVAERKRAQQELVGARDLAEQANQTKSQFLANMSHELRTPLNSIIGFANILMKNKEGNLRPQDLTYLDRVLTNGKHLLELINQILDLAKIEAGRMELDRQAVDLGRLVRETVAQMEGRVIGASVALSAEVPDPVAPMEIDSGKFKQVLINLIGNALKFTEQGSVTVRVLVNPATRVPVRVAVVDTGIGIPGDRQAAVFEAFQQADNTTARKYGGTGLGLTITRSLCHLMGFRIEVASKAGRGSTFTVVLGTGEAAATAPLAPGKAAGVPATAPTRILKGKKVLIIDDEADARTVLREYVQDCGCVAAVAESGRRGLELARESRPDVITLDLFMPEMTGWEVLRLLKEDPQLRGIPVVVVSIVAKESRGTLIGAIDCISKPVSREEIQEALRRNLPAGPGKVLVVDDNEDVRGLISSLLSEEKVEVATAANGREALDALARSPADLILLDLMMPVMDGMAFLEERRKDPRLGAIPVVVVTAKELAPEERRDLGSLCAAVVRKGESLETDIRRALKEILSRPGADRR